MRFAGQRLAASFTLALGLLAAPTARAADGDTQRARALFEEAGELERHGHWGAAQEKLRAALRLRETPQLHYALGWAFENDDKLIEAKAEYETAARSGRDLPGGEEGARLAAARLADLDDKTPVIQIRLGGAAKRSARVIVDGREIKRADDVARTSVNPGSHIVRIESEPGVVEQVVYVGRSTVRTVDIDTGEGVAQRDTSPERHEGAAAPATDAYTRPATSSRFVPWLLVSGGIAFVAGGSALLVSSASDADTRDEMQSRWCTATACRGGTTATLPESAEAAASRRASADAASSGNTKQAFAFVLGGAGLVAAAVGTVMLLRSSEPANERAAKPKTARTTANVAPLPGGGFASASFSF